MSRAPRAASILLAAGTLSALALAALASAPLSAGAPPGRSGEPAGERKLSVVLRPSASAAGPFVRLAEVAELRCDLGGLAQRVGEILLGAAPPSGEERSIAASEIASRLRELGIPEGAFLILGSPRAAVLSGGSAPSAAAATITVAAPGTGGGSVRRTVLSAAPAAKPPRGAPAARATAAAAAATGTEAPSSPPAARRGLEKGATVTIRRIGAALVIEEPGKLLGPAEPGDSVEVQILRTGGKERLRLVDEGTAVPIQPEAAPRAHETPPAETPGEKVGEKAGEKE